MSAARGQQLRAVFAQEAETRLAQLGRLLLQLEQQGQDGELIRCIYRELHTLKGSAGVVGLDEVSRRAHELEELVEGVSAGQRPITAELIDQLLAGADALSALVLTSTAAPAAPVQPAAAVQSAAPVQPAASVQPAAPVHAAAPAEPPAVDDSAAIMVPAHRLEELTRLVGESAAAHLRIGRMLKDRFDVDAASCAEFNELARCLNDLQDRAMRTQMVPVSTITDRLHRAVRDLARARGKDIRWEVRGGDTELDRGVLHRLADSLIHLVRNAVDHGIESRADREQAGKPTSGTIRLHAMQLGSEVIITVSDDGRGVDASAVQKQATAHGIDTTGLDEAELLELAFRPGLSTASAVTDVSGRGVGLDAVRSNVERVRGRVEVRSLPGAGAEFRIIVPITLAVLRCLLIEAGGQRFALPFHRVVLSQPYVAETIGHAEGRPVVSVDGMAIAVSGLPETLGVPAGESTDGPIVVLADTSRRHAFQVDRLLGQRDVVVKGLSRLLPHLPAVAGASVEPDGSVLLVLDPPGLIERARRSRVALAHVAVATPAEAPGPASRRVLVVDDALTVRELQRGILERAGYDVRVAADGVQALRSLDSEPSDLVLTDIEMPVMDGFALTEAIRSHPTFATVPILILSSRSSEADRQRGLDAGADGYIVKSGFDEGGLLTAVHRLLGAGA
jgi:two-component system chemotaxis sensor kinase CheA